MSKAGMIFLFVFISNLVNHLLFFAFFFFSFRVFSYYWATIIFPENKAKTYPVEKDSLSHFQPPRKMMPLNTFTRGRVWKIINSFLRAGVSFPVFLVSFLYVVDDSRTFSNQCTPNTLNNILQGGKVLYTSNNNR